MFIFNVHKKSQYFDVGNQAAYISRAETKPVPGLRPVQARPRFGPGGKAVKAESNHSLSETLSLTVRAGMPLSQLNIALLDTDTKLILAEKEQALLGNRFRKIRHHK